MFSLRSKLFSFFSLCIFLILISAGLQSMRGGSAAIVISGQRATQKLLNKNDKLGANKRFFSLSYQTLKKLVTWNWGKTIYGKPINDILALGFQRTAIVAVAASVFSLIVGLFFGILASLFKSLKFFIEKVSFILLSFPVFIIAILLISFLSIYLGLLPPGGTEHPLWFLLPAVALGLKASARITLFFIDFSKSEQEKPYLELLKLYRVSPIRYFILNMLPNIALPIISLWLIEFSSYLAGAAITEMLFSIPGLGFLLLKSIQSYDMNLLLAVLFTSAFSIFLVSQLQQTLEQYIVNKKLALT